MEAFYEGWNVDVFSQAQTLFQRATQNMGARMYSGYDELTFGSDFMPRFPLDVRFASFKRRLAKAMAK